MLSKNRFKIEYALIGLLSSVLIYFLAQLGVFSPVVAWIRYLSGGFQDSFYKWGVEINSSIYSITNIGNLAFRTDNLEAENADLKSRLAQVEAEKLLLQKQVSQNTKLQGRENIRADVRYMSEIMSELIINVGTADGVKKGDVVVISNIPLGYISETSGNYSRVITIHADTIKIPVKFIDSGILGFLEYDNGLGFLIKNLPSGYTFAKNEQVITTGINSPYFYGLYVGSADEVVGSQTDPAKTVKLSYPLDFSEIQTVFVILNSAIETPAAN